MIKLSTTKSRKQQIIPLSTSLCKILEEYLQYRNGEDEDYLLLTYAAIAKEIDLEVKCQDIHYLLLLLHTTEKEE